MPTAKSWPRIWMIVEVIFILKSNKTKLDIEPCCWITQQFVITSYILCSESKLRNFMLRFFFKWKSSVFSYAIWLLKRSVPKYFFCLWLVVEPANEKAPENLLEIKFSLLMSLNWSSISKKIDFQILKTPSNCSTINFILK